MHPFHPSEADVHAFVRNGLKAWHKPNHPVPYADQLLLVEQAKRGDTHTQNRHADHLAIKQVIVDGIEKLRIKDERDAQILEQRYFDKLLVKEVASAQGLKLEQIKYRIREGSKLLAAIVFADECASRLAEINRLQIRLPDPTYRTFFGDADHCQTLEHHLLSADPDSWFVAVTGIGGIGKTSLVREAVFQTVKGYNFRELIWLHMREGQLVNRNGGEVIALDADALFKLLLQTLDSSFPQNNDPVARLTHLRHCLTRRRTLLVIDNLERLTEVELLLQHLDPLANPLQIVITSRERPAPRRKLLIYKLGELDWHATAALIRQHAGRVGCHLLAEGNDDLVRQIYDAVGGNPLAVKLIVGLTAELELQPLLADLVTATHRDIDQMYRYIFIQAWQQLSENAQLLLMVMPLATEKGMSLTAMQHNSGLDFGQVSGAIAELTKRSLLDVGGTTKTRTYTIHQLTRAFLGSHVINWAGTLPGS